MTKRPHVLITFFWLALTLCAGACGAAGSPEPSEQAAGGESEAVTPEVTPIAVGAWTEPCVDPIETLAAVQDAARFMQLLAPARMVQTFAELQGATVFVPTNAALDALDSAVERDPAALRNFLAGHFTMGTLSTTHLLEAESIEMFDQQRTTLPVSHERGATTVGPAHVIRPDLQCPGVTVHLVDAVLPVGAFDAQQSPNPFQVNLWRLPAE